MLHLTSFNWLFINEPLGTNNENYFELRDLTNFTNKDKCEIHPIDDFSRDNTII